MRPLLIVGIDPGVTVGYALLDVQGKVIKLDSSKNLDLDTLVAQIIKFGIPLVVGCDKAKTPGFVEKFATKVGAKLVWPAEDLKVGEKRELARNHACDNDHELDALASAFFAFKKVSGLLRRIDKFLAGKKRMTFAGRVKELVVKKGIHMSGALDMLLEPEQKEARIIKKVVDEKKLDEGDFLRIYNELKKAEADKKRLRQQNTRLQQQSKKSDKLLSEFRNKAANKPKVSEGDKLRFKDEKIRFLSESISEKEKTIGLLKKEISRFYAALASIEDKFVVKKLKNLGWNELAQKKNLLKIKKGDVLLVDDPNSYSDKAIEQLRGLVDIIIHKKDVGKKLSGLGFIFISSDLVEFEENEYFAFVNKGHFEEARRNKELLKNIIKTYKKKRAT